MADLVAFLEARITEDEALAVQALRKLPSTVPAQIAWSEDGSDITNPQVVVGDDLRWSPRRVLAECAAKRAVLKLWQTANNQTTHADAWILLTQACIALAQPYAGHPDFHPDWANG